MLSDLASECHASGVAAFDVLVVDEATQASEPELLSESLAGAQTPDRLPAVRCLAPHAAAVVDARWLALRLA